METQAGLSTCRPPAPVVRQWVSGHAPEADRCLTCLLVQWLPLPWLHWYGNAIWILGGAAWAGGEQWSRSLAKWRKLDVLTESNRVCLPGLLCR